MRKSLMTILVFPMVLAGCVATMTSAQKQGNALAAKSQASWAETKACQEDAMAKMPDEVKLIDTILITGPSDPDSFTKKMSKEFISAEMSGAYLKYISVMGQCASEQEERLSKFFPAGASVYREYNSAKDKTKILYLEGKLTNGQVNEQLTDLYNLFKKQMDSAWQEIFNQLNSSHNQEMAQRQAAWAAYSQSMAATAERNAQIMQNFQNSLQQNKPVYTNCTKFGYTINCVSN